MVGRGRGRAEVEEHPGVRARLSCPWDALDAAVLEKGLESLIDDPTRFDGVDAVGVDEHVWRHTRHEQVRDRRRRPHSQETR